MVPALSLLSSVLFVFASAAPAPKLRGSKITPPASLTCHVQLILVDSGDANQVNEIFECTPVDETCTNDQSYEMELPSDMVEEYRNEIEAGSLFVSVPGGHIEDHSVVIPDTTAIDITDPPAACQSRRLSQRSLGTKSVLVLRVTTNDSTPDYTAAELDDFLFSDDREISLKNQFEACSMGRMTIQPTTQGVMEVSIDIDAGGSRSGSLVNAASVAAASMLGVNSIQDYADHVMFCLPPGTGSWAATAGVNSWKSAYNNRWCAYPSGYMHEIGHNIGLGHANSEGRDYMDYSGYMSAGTSNTERPFKCFNGGNNWHLGWYADHATEVDLSLGPQLLTVAAFVDYNKATSNQHVLVKAGDLYMQYNRAKGVNRESGKAENQLTVTQKDDDKASTDFVAGLDLVTPLLHESNFTGSGSTLVVEVCDVVTFDTDQDADYMVISVGYDISLCGFQGAQQETTTDSPTVSPTTSPSTSPSESPSMAPSESSVPSSSSAPSQSPSQSAAPSSSPSDESEENAAFQGASESTTSGTGCDDSTTEKFFVNDTEGEQSCIWLAARAEWQQLLCVEGHPANTLCPETCGVCTDTCEDDPTTSFDVNGAVRNCQWLAIRPNLWPTLCVEGSDAFNGCHETCENCA